ncbi:hypothetical protein [Actinomadura sp. 6N118]|uniref:hypothetical protein n=1 Tax=Actinomadura sp. 6N118 TaxID=3375151 RepID=UPI0037AC2F13
MLRCYRRNSDDRWSPGSEALSGGGSGGFVRHDATAAGSPAPDSSFLRRSRDLAAWGIATSPAFQAPNLDWATTRRRN